MTALRQGDQISAVGLQELTKSERKVLDLMADGLSNAAIASELYLSVRTVECYVRTIFLKLGLLPCEAKHRRVAAVLVCLSVSGTAQQQAA